jgi:hypothetical protein
MEMCFSASEFSIHNISTSTIERRISHSDVVETIAKVHGSSISLYEKNGSK